MDEFIEEVSLEDRERVRRARYRLINEGAHYDEEFRIRPPAGETRWLRSQAALFRHGDGRPWKVVGVVSDITARKEAEQAPRRNPRSLR
jgi:PAS domain S-box-containing protein